MVGKPFKKCTVGIGKTMTEPSVLLTGFGLWEIGDMTGKHIAVKILQGVAFNWCPLKIRTLF